MERTPQPQGGEPLRPIGTPTSEVANAAAAWETTQSWDERVIREGVELALIEDRSIDHRIARYIAGQLHGGQASGLYALASSGAVTESAIRELVDERAVRPTIIQIWIDALIAYCAQRADLGPIVGWAEQGEAHDPADLMERIAADSVTPLGDLAVAHTPEPAESVDDEHDTFAWGDAARWSPNDAAAAEIGMLTDDELDMLLSTVPDEEIGDVDDLGWYGLIRADDRPGGYIVAHHNNGTRQVLECVTNDALTEAWSNVTRNYERYYIEREAYENATSEASDSLSGISPQIWVGSLADYNNGYLHGEWFDATHDADELALATQFMLRGSRMPNAEEWAIMDYHGFGPLQLGEYVSFERVSRIANGIAELGEAFAAWAGYVGPEDDGALDRFADHYRGEWESFKAYVEDYLHETDFYRFLDHVPEDMRGYIDIDVEQIADDWSSDYEVVERSEGGVWVFDPRT